MAHKRDPIVTNNPVKGNGYQALTPENREKAFANYGIVVQEFGSIVKAGVGDGITTRAPSNKQDFLYQRPREIGPTTFKDIVLACRNVYLRVGIVRNIIDLLTDFATEDLNIVHPNKSTEAFLKVWRDKVKLNEAVTEFVRHFLVDATVVVRRTTARLSVPVEQQWTDKTMAADVTLYKDVKPPSREIPWRYSFLNILALDWMGGDLDSGQDSKQLVFRPSTISLNKIKLNSDPFYQAQIAKLPQDILSTTETNKGVIPLDMSKLYVAFNKKDSWENWAPPFLYAALADIHFKDKLRQMENATTDGAINPIRLWKLGDHKAGFLPDTASFRKLNDVLAANPGGTVMDLLWDSMIEMQEFYPPIDKILGSEKYTQVNKDILIALGVPEVLIGGEGANFSNSWIQLKTIVEKLKYVRNAVLDWLTGEIDLLCGAMGIAIAPKIRFNDMNLEDANVARRLIVGLWDRGIVSSEAVLNMYGEDFLIETERIPEEYKMFDQLGIQTQGPFTQPYPVEEFYDETGITRFGKPASQPAGRPPATKDVTRKNRKAKPRRASGKLMVEALDILDKVEEHIIPMYMEGLVVTNARKLTNEQKDDINNVRVLLLACISPGTDLSADSLMAIAANPSNPNHEVVESIGSCVSGFIKDKNALPTVSQRKRLESIGWALAHGGNEDAEI